jgi:hypothetical protein
MTIARVLAAPPSIAGTGALRPSLEFLIERPGNDKDD